MPQPVDLQTEVARVTAAERIQEIASRLSLAAQQRAVAEAEDDRVVNEQQVKESQESQSEQVDAEGRRQNPFMGRRRRRGEGETDQGASPVLRTEEDAEDADDGEGHRLDVSV